MRLCSPYAAAVAAEDAPRSAYGEMEPLAEDPRTCDWSGYGGMTGGGAGAEGPREWSE